MTDQGTDPLSPGEWDDEVCPHGVDHKGDRYCTACLQYAVQGE